VKRDPSRAYTEFDVTTHTHPEPAEPLTDREQQVLDLLRLGLTNRQIAARLGISADGAKYHVSEIIGKLGVRNRYDAAVWPERRPWWSLGAFAPAALLRRAQDLTWLSPAVAGALAVVVAAGVGLLVWGVVRMNSDDAEQPAAANGLASPGALSSPGQATNELVTYEIRGPPAVVGPLDASQPIPTAQLQANARYVVDVATGQLYVARLPLLPEGDFVRVAGWLDDDTLLFLTRSEAYEIGLDGEVRQVAPPAEATATPEGPLLSLDGAWSVSSEAGPYGGLLVARAGEEASFRLANATGAAWSPAGSRLAALGLPRQPEG
jgi:DNA-binding CsgD family transcriptional regulator